MAKYCGNCGTQLEDDVKACGNCGMPVEDTIVPMLSFKDPEKQKKTKKTVTGIIAAVALVVAVVIAFNIVFQFTGYNGLLRKTMKAYENYDIDTLISLSSNVYYYEDDEDWIEEYFEYHVGKDIDLFDTEVGHNYKITYEVNEIYSTSERGVSEILKYIESTYPDFDIDTIQKIVIADVTTTVKQSDRSSSCDITVVMTKENGDWKLLYLE